MSKTIMLIHGAWLNSKSWEGFKARYEADGYTVVAPDWPYDDRDPADLRASPRPELARLGQREIIDHYERLIRALPEEPIPGEAWRIAAGSRPTAPGQLLHSTA